MADALVGGHTEPKKSTSGVRHTYDGIFCDLLSFENFYTMKRNSLKFLPLLTISLIFACAACQPKAEKTEAAPAVNELPYLPFVKLGGEQLSAHDLPGKTILILFNTECDHCHNEAREIHKNLSSFRGYTLYFLASDSVASIAKFSTDYQLANQPNIFFGRAEVEDVVRNFGPIAAPSVYIYSAEKKLVKYFNGETPVGQIINFL